MDVGIRLAARNKEIIAQEIMAFLGVDEKDGAIKTNHNYYDRGERTVRKGAVSAKKDELFLCPINMRDGVRLSARVKGTKTGISPLGTVRGVLCRVPMPRNCLISKASVRHWANFSPQRWIHRSMKRRMRTRVSISSANISHRRRRLQIGLFRCIISKVEKEENK